MAAMAALTARLHSNAFCRPAPPPAATASSSAGFESLGAFSTQAHSSSAPGTRTPCSASMRIVAASPLKRFTPRVRLYRFTSIQWGVMSPAYSSSPYTRMSCGQKA
ncbi:MAG: hypothetical protein ACLVJ8_12140 [Ruthenibacterium lactatiformans]